MAVLRLRGKLPMRPARVSCNGEIALVVPARDEEGRIGALIARLPPTVQGIPTRCIVVDDGSSDSTVAEAIAVGAEVVAHASNLGLGAAIRTGLRAAVAHGCQVVAFCDGDGEYSPEQLDRMCAPILSGEADYVVGSRFSGQIRRMRLHRRFGNVVLTRWVRWMVRQPVTDGQSGFRALSWQAAAAAELIHDYNYAQVLTLNLIGKGFVYAEVPIDYEFRASGRSFVRVVPYVRRVIPAAIREIRRQSSTT